jgi:hypothetical protein
VESGWDTLQAMTFGICEAVRVGLLDWTKGRLGELAKELEPFEGVPEMFGRVREAAQAIVPDVTVSFHLITCGLVDVHEQMDVAEHFDTMYGTQFHFDSDGKPRAARRVLTHAQKVPYLQSIAMGLGPEGGNEPSEVYKDIAHEDWLVPYDQVIYVGDGKSDMPLFDFLENEGGLAIAVVNEDEVEDWAGYDSTAEDRRVQNLAAADYSEDSELMQSLILGTESIAKLVALRKLSAGQ